MKGDRDETRRLYRIPLDGGGAMPLHALDTDIRGFSFSPDGRRVALVALESEDARLKPLRDKGFDVQTPEFTRLSGSQGGKPVLTVAGRTHRVDQASLLITTPPGGLRAQHIG